MGKKRNPLKHEACLFVDWLFFCGRRHRAFLLWGGPEAKGWTGGPSMWRVPDPQPSHRAPPMFTSVCQWQGRTVSLRPPLNLQNPLVLTTASASVAGWKVDLGRVDGGGSACGSEPVTDGAGAPAPSARPGASRTPAEEQSEN